MDDDLTTSAENDTPDSLREAAAGKLSDALSVSRAVFVQHLHGNTHAVALCVNYARDCLETSSELLRGANSILGFSEVPSEVAA